MASRKKNRIYNVEFTKSIADALKLQGKAPQDILSKIRVVHLASAEATPLWTIPRNYYGDFKCSHGATGVGEDQTVNVPDGKIWMVVGFRIAKYNGAEDVALEWVEVDDNEIIDRNSMAPGGSNYFDFGTDTKELIFIGDGDTAYSEANNLEIYRIIPSGTPMVVRDKIEMMFGTFTDASVSWAIWYYERDMEYWEEETVVNE